jgi:hypothetical protein
MNIMNDPRKIAEEYAHTLVDTNKITVDQWHIVVDAVMYGHKLAILNLSNINTTDSIYLLPNPLPIDRK